MCMENVIENDKPDDVERIGWKVMSEVGGELFFEWGPWNGSKSEPPPRGCWIKSQKLTPLIAQKCGVELSNHYAKGFHILKTPNFAQKYMMMLARPNCKVIPVKYKKITHSGDVNFLKISGFVVDQIYIPKDDKEIDELQNLWSQQTAVAQKSVSVSGPNKS